MQFSPYGSTITLVFAVSTGNSDGVPLSRGINQGWGGVRKTRYFLALCINISKTVRDTSTVTINN